MVGVALAVACGATPVPASPSSQAVSSKAALDKAVQDYQAASKRLSAIDESLTANSTTLDELVEQQSELEARLGGRASSMYRAGPLGFLEVLAGSATFDQFLTVWDALLRFNRQDIDTGRRLKRAREQVRRSTAQLVQQQEEASRRLRALEATKAEAARALAQDAAAYESYKKRVAASEALQALRARAAASKRTASKTSVPQTRSGSGDWKTGVASHYGRGSYGIRLASGVTIGPDSMIVAHKTLPFGTLVEFSYKGRTAVAKVADRGPYTKGRMWDLGPGTARVLGFQGVGDVRYRIIGR